MPRDARSASSKPLSIRDQADLVLRLPAADRLKLLLEAPKPMALVRALPDGDFFLTIREVGPLDSLPLLSLASAGQITHVLDLESWRGDRFDALRSGAWVALIAETDEAALRRFTRNADDEMLILLLRDWARVQPLDIDHEEPTKGHGITEFGDERGFVTPDGAHLFAPERSEHAPAVRRFAEMLYGDDEAHYHGLLRSAFRELPSELEEMAYRWRNARLEEHGYPPFEEALSVYGAPASTAPLTEVPEPAAPDGLAAPRAALRVLGSRDLVASAVAPLPDGERERVLFELTSLANRVLVADREDPGSPEAQFRVIARTGSYVGLALEARRADDPAAAARVLAGTSAVELFREGFQLVSALGDRARAGAANVLDLLEAPLRARIGALLEPRPLYVETGESGIERSRDFRHVTEIEETRVLLDLVDALGAVLLESHGLDPATLRADERRAFEDVPRFSTLLLTALAWQVARGESRVDRLPSDVVADFLRTTASRRTSPADAPGRAMRRLTDALALEAGLDRRTAAALGAFGTSCLPRLEADCSGLDPGIPVTARVVGCLRLS